MAGNWHPKAGGQRNKVRGFRYNLKRVIFARIRSTASVRISNGSFSPDKGPDFFVKIYGIGGFPSLGQVDCVAGLLRDGFLCLPGELSTLLIAGPFLCLPGELNASLTVEQVLRSGASESDELSAQTYAIIVLCYANKTACIIIRTSIGGTT